MCTEMTACAEMTVTTEMMACTVYMYTSGHDTAERGTEIPWVRKDVSAM